MSALPVIEPSLSSDECYRCGYALLGIANEQACPECGLLAERSRRVTDELHDTRPKWLGRLALGTKLILASLIVGAVWPFVVALLEARLLRILVTPGRRPLWVSFFGYEVVPFAGVDLCVLLFTAGVWLLTLSERYAPAEQADRLRRLFLRISSFFPLLACLTLHAIVWWTRNFFVGPRVRDELEWLWIAFWVFVALSAITIPPLLFRQLRSLAVRARSAHLAEHCTIVGIGAACALAFLLLALGSLAFPDVLGLPETWSTTSQASLLIMCAGCVGAVLFLLWSTYLLIRFTISFHRAARVMRKKWARDDRSLTSAPPDAV